MDRTKFTTRENVDFSLFKTPWQGWYFKNGMLWDDGGNMYTERDVAMAWKAGMTLDNHFGTESKIMILKKELERKIDMAKLPKVCLVWETHGGTVEKVYNLNEE